MTIIAIIIGLAGHIFGWFTDYDHSRRFIYYRSKEGNTLFTAKNGQMSKSKAFLSLAIGQAFSVGVFLLGLAFYNPLEGQTSAVAYYGYMMSALGFGAGHFIHVKFMEKGRRNERLRQISWRAGLKARLTGDREKDEEIAIRALANNVGGYRGEWFPTNAQWIRVPAGSADEGLRLLAPKLVDWLMLPETDQKAIWHDLKYHPKS